MDTTDALVESIQAKGERLTIPRRLVVEALGQSHEHLTINDIQRHIREVHRDNPLSDTTVYRVLQWLKDLGLISQTDMGRTGIVYALNMSPSHHHLICLKCGATLTIEDDLLTVLRQELHSHYGFEARIDHMAIYGLCRNCRDS